MKIYDGNDLAKIEGRGSYRDRITQLYVRLRARGADIKLSGEVDKEADPVRARIDYGRYIGDCPACGGAEYVTPEDPVFYCFSCGNSTIGGKFRKVLFPRKDIREKVEELLLERPVSEVRGTNKVDRAIKATAKVRGLDPETGVEFVLNRSWDPDESLEDLRSQNSRIPKGMRVKKGDIKNG